MAGFLERLRRKSSTGSLQRERVTDSLQTRLHTYQLSSSRQEERRPPVPEVSIKKLEDDANGYVKDFRSYVKQMKETSLRLEELTKLLRSGEIPENAYRLIVGELGQELSLFVDDIFRLRELLELTRAKARLEWAKEKVSGPTNLMEAQESVDKSVKGYTGTSRKIYFPDLHSIYFPDQHSIQRIHSLNLQRCEELISKIDSALSSLPIEEETAIVEHYLSLIKDKLALEGGSGEMERGLSVCQQRLTSISERWASARRSQIEQIMNLELEASRVKDEIKELEVRFAISEIAQDTFEYKMSALLGTLKKVEKEISDIRSFIDDMDMKIFRCSELLRKSL